MYSRLALRLGLQNGFFGSCIRPVTTSPVSFAAADQGEGNLPRPVRAERSGKVRLGFIPEEWFQFFYPKTGVTGPYMFGVSVGTYLLSKEIYVLEHEYYTGLSIIIMCVIGVKKLGPSVAASLDKQIDDMAKAWDEGRETSLKNLKNQIQVEENEQWRSQGQLVLLEAKRENIQLQLEAAYRERLMKVYSEVKKRLDYQVEKQEIERRIAQKNLVDWVVRSVVKSISPQQEKDTLQKCVADLNALAARA